MKRSLLLSLLAPLVAAGSVHAASDYLLEIDGIKGESSDDRHAQSIEIESFGWGTTNSPSASSGGGGGAGKVVFSDMHFVAKMSKASPQLLFDCASPGTSSNGMRRATLFMRKAGAGAAGGTQQEYLTITLTDVFISSYQSSSRGDCATSGEIVPTDQFSLNFAKVTISYTGLDGVVTTGTAVRTPPQTPPQ